MIRDIRPPEVTDIAVAAIPQNETGENPEWKVYLLNLKDVAIEGVLVSSKGYGKFEGEVVKTSMLRHFLDKMEPMSYQLIEPVMPEVLSLNNEYWVSFYIKKVMYDKKFIFLPGSLQADFFTTIPLLEERGVMIR